MSDHILQQLQKSADLARKSSSVEEGVYHLARAFTLFLRETKHLQEALSTMQERLHTVNLEFEEKTRWLDRVLKKSSDAIILLKMDGSFLFFNKKAEELFQQKQEQLLSYKFWDIFPDDILGFSIKESLHFGIFYENFIYQHMQITTEFIFEGPKASHALLINIRDLREKQEFERQLNRDKQLKKLGETAATLAHEIRNSLGAIRGFASLLIHDLKEDQNLQEMASAVLDGIKSLEKMVSATLYYAKPIAIDIRTSDLRLFLKRVGQCLKVDPALPKMVRFSMHIPEAPLFAPFDPEALKRAIINLGLNAFQAMPKGGDFSISLLRNETFCQIDLSDTGLGMDENQLHLIFSPFYTTKQRGNGLGLVETQKIIQAHGGAIDVRSKPNQGTTFTIHLPLKR